LSIPIENLLLAESWLLKSVMIISTRMLESLLVSPFSISSLALNAVLVRTSFCNIWIRTLAHTPSLELCQVNNV